MSSHIRFIKTPIETVVEDAISACTLCGEGMEGYPLSEYFLSSLFLKMTGFGEQKLKCILWEIATVDFEFRYRYVSGKDKFSECSNYDDKNRVLRVLIDEIISVNTNINITGIKNNLLKETYDYCKDAFEKSRFRDWRSKEYNLFLGLNISSLDSHILTYSQGNYQLFQKNTEIYNLYSSLYRQRNRFAHNTYSFQENLPTLRVLKNEEYEENNNIFSWFFLLIYIDRLFIKVFELYEETQKEVY